MFWKIAGTICVFLVLLFLLVYWIVYVTRTGAAGVELLYKAMPAQVMFCAIGCIWVLYVFGSMLTLQKRLTLITLVLSLSVVVSLALMVFVGLYLLGVMGAIDAGAIELLAIICFAAIWTIYAVIRWVIIPAVRWIPKRLQRKKIGE